MPLEINDTILTAYALDELNAADRAAVELHLQSHPADQQMIADVRSIATQMSAQLAIELIETPRLPIARPTPRRWARAAIGLAAAAAIAAGVGVYVHLSHPDLQNEISVQALVPTPQQFAAHSTPNFQRNTGPAEAVKTTVPVASSQHDDLNHSPDLNLGTVKMTSAAMGNNTPQDPFSSQTGSVGSTAASSVNLASNGSQPFGPMPVKQDQSTGNTTPHDQGGKVVAYDDTANYSQSPSIIGKNGATANTGSNGAVAINDGVAAANARVTEFNVRVQNANSESTTDKKQQGISPQHVQQIVESDPDVIRVKEQLDLIQNRMDEIKGEGTNSPAWKQLEKSQVLDQKRLDDLRISKTNDEIRSEADDRLLSTDPDIIVHSKIATGNVSGLNYFHGARDAEVSSDRGDNTEDSALPAQLDHHLPELRFNQNNLADVIDFMRDVTGTNITVDWDALQKVGITKDTPITGRFRDIKFGDALDVILKSASNGVSQAGYKLENGQITIYVGPDVRVETLTTNTESYSPIVDHPFLSSLHSPLSTFAVDVDTASYSNVRRFIDQGQLPPANAVRIEELINYFPYDMTGPKQDDPSPLKVKVEVADCPWQPSHRLARVALKAKSMPEQKRPASNLTFLIDISGSMADENKLPLLKTSLKKLVGRLSATDRVSIVTYASTTQIALPSTPCGEDGDRQKIISAIDNLNAEGSTDGGDGIQLAYKTAVENFIKGGVNRIILSTDGDFNVGIVDPNQLTAMIEREANTGVYLTVLGVGMGNVKDSTMEKLADHGKGNYAYLDTVEEADKVLGRQLNATLVTVAKDVKLQIEFNPNTVAGYRLIGYEDRGLANKDFNDDKKSAGEMGAGHTVTALYELIPANNVGHTIALKYQPVPPPSTNPIDHELMTVNVRYQPPQGGESTKIEVPVVDEPEASANSTSDFRFSAAVASFGMILRNSPYRGNATLDSVVEMANAAKGEDAGGYRTQFVEMVQRVKKMTGR